MPFGGARRRRAPSTRIPLAHSALALPQVPFSPRCTVAYGCPGHRRLAAGEEANAPAVSKCCMLPPRAPRDQGSGARYARYRLVPPRPVPDPPPLGEGTARCPPAGEAGGADQARCRGSTRQPAFHASLRPAPSDPPRQPGNPHSTRASGPRHLALPPRPREPEARATATRQPVFYFTRAGDPGHVAPKRSGRALTL